MCVGCKYRFRSINNICLQKVNINQIKWLLKQNSSDKYFHPLPTLREDKKLWVNNMVNAIKSIKMFERNI